MFCGLCGAKLKYCHNTTNMGTHLKGVHPLFYAKSELQKKSTDEASSSKICTAGGNEGTPEDESQRTLEESFPATTTMPAGQRTSLMPLDILWPRISCQLALLVVLGLKG